MHRAMIRGGLVALTMMTVAACQGYDFLFQPDATRRGEHLRFAVETPSKADILFVVDNSPSMYKHQQALKASIGLLLDQLAPNDTSYRIGIVSTDDIGWTEDCCGNAYSLGYPTTLDRCDTFACPGGVPEIKLRRPHDGAYGRLMAAYDPSSFNTFAYTTLLDTTEKQNAFAALVPTAVDAGPVDAGNLPTSVTGAEGVPWVIDRDIVRRNACTACNCDCTVDDFKHTDCYLNCVEDVSAAIVKAYFSSNIEGLGTNGMGWEQGIKSALLSVGVDPTLAGDAALAPANSTLHAENTYTALGASGPVPEAKWIRDEAILGVMYLSDEEDCSMQTQALQLLVTLEDPPGHQDLTKGPIGSGCYQTDGQALLVDTTRLGQLFTGRKGSRVAFGFIGGVKPTGPADGDKKYISGVADDCSGSGATPSYVCSCVTPVPATSDLDSRWCSYTQDTSYPPATTCDALAGNRYVKTMRDNFSRLTYDSICQADYGGALQAFAKKLISACFEIDVDVRPANDDPSNIEVIRTPKADQGSNATPSTVTPLADCNEAGPGWCYIPPIIPASTDTNTKIQRPQVCLVGFDRLIGDVYDIFILSTNYFDASR